MDDGCQHSVHWVINRGMRPAGHLEWQLNPVRTRLRTGPEKSTAHTMR